MRFLSCFLITVLFSCQVALTQTESSTVAGQQNAITTLRKAAEGGDIDAQCKLGAIYFLGLEIPQDYSEAYFWYDLAASGNAKVTSREDIDELRDDAAKHLTPADLNRVQERVQKWLEAHETSATATLDSTAATGSSQSFASQYWAQKFAPPSKPTETGDEGTPHKNVEVSSSTDISGAQRAPPTTRHDL